MKQGQKGLTLMGLILIAVLAGCVLIVGLKVVPSVIEYYTIMKNIKTIANGEAATVEEVRRAYDQQTITDRTPSVSGADLDIFKDGSQYIISFEYAKKIPIAGNVSILIDYSGSTDSGRRRVGG
ncbi:MAG: DUF4845 domain-containing protein [Zoogloeaceae bacterium]|jgi:hypothetical protein|nr:DUF4845 domain-containing protein [Zoogloeaceae bacterium]